MRALFALFCVLLVTLGSGASFSESLAFRGQFLSANAITPATISSLQRWWNFHDFATNVVVSNQWNDEIFGKPLWQMNTVFSPTNSSLGVRFNGAQGLTNDPVPFMNGTTNTFALVMTFEGALGAENVINEGAGQGGFALDSSAHLNWEAGFTTVSLALPLATLIDIAAVQSNANLYVYTNGVLSKLLTATGVQRPIVLASNYTASIHVPLKGYVLHYLYWSNALSSVQVSNFHYWRTNTEGGSP